MMNYQSTSRNQHPKGLRIKQALQFTLILAIFIWLLYQIKPSHNENKNHGGNAQSKLSEESGSVILGRKGNAVWSSDRGDSNSEDANFVGENEKKEDVGAGNEEVYRNSKENVKAESYLKEKNIAAHEERKKPNNDLVLDKYEAVKENHEDEVSTKRAFRTAVQHGGMVHVIIPGHREMEDGAHSFHDENGVPQDLESDYQKINLHHATISTSNNQSRLVESMPVEGEDLESKEGRVIAENENNGSVKDSKNDIKTDADSDASKTVLQEKSKDSEDFSSLSSRIRTRGD